MSYGYLHLARVIGPGEVEDTFYVRSVALARTSKWGPIPSCVPGLAEDDQVVLGATGTSRDNMVILGRVGNDFPDLDDIPGLVEALASKADAAATATALNALALADIALANADVALDGRLDIAEALLVTHTGTLATHTTNIATNVTNIATVAANLATHAATLGLHGGILPVADVTARAALTGLYDGKPIYRKDRDWIEIHDGTAWRVQGVATCASVADRNSAITHPVDGQFAVTVDTDILWQYDGAAWLRMGGPKDAWGLLAPPVQGTGNVNFGGETLIDSITFTHTVGRYERVNFGSRFSLNTAGVAVMNYRYVSGSGPVLTSSTSTYDTIPTGSGSNNHMSLSKILPAAFRALATGTYTIAATAAAAAGASTGVMNGSAGGNSRDFSVEDLGAP